MFIEAQVPDSAVSHAGIVQFTWWELFQLQQGH